MTADVFLASPLNEGRELLDGVPTEAGMGGLSAWIGGKVYARLDAYLQRHPSGLGLPADAGYALWPLRAAHVRKPDVSYLSFERLGATRPPDGWITVPPDLAIEVVSPNDPASDLETKITELLEAGVDLIWVIQPEVAATYVHRRDRSVVRVPAHELLDAGPLLPGFSLRLADILDRIPAAP
jgi:Uma2 family endonuclease